MKVEREPYIVIQETLYLTPKYNDTPKIRFFYFLLPASHCIIRVGPFRHTNFIKFTGG